MPNSAEMLPLVRDVLIKEWDPIGVHHIPQCRDEYDSYAPFFVRLLLEGADERRIAAQLRRLRLDNMGLPAADDAGDLEVARHLLALASR